MSLRLSHQQQIWENSYCYKLLYFSVHASHHTLTNKVLFAACSDHQTRQFSRARTKQLFQKRCYYFTAYSFWNIAHHSKQQQQYSRILVSQGASGSLYRFKCFDELMVKVSRELERQKCLFWMIHSLPIIIGIETGPSAFILFVLDEISNNGKIGEKESVCCNVSSIK